MLLPGQGCDPGFDVVYLSFDASSVGLLSLISLTHTCRDLPRLYRNVHHRDDLSSVGAISTPSLPPSTITSKSGRSKCLPPASVARKWSSRTTPVHMPSRARGSSRFG